MSVKKYPFLIEFLVRITHKISIVFVTPKNNFFRGDMISIILLYKIICITYAMKL